MKESVIYQEILLEGEAKGLAKGEARGIAKGKAETARQIALNMMHSNIAGDLVAQFTGLSLKEVQKLSAKKAQSPKTAKTKRSPKT
jgi:predicted transposase/invertase (TIGR01784 family)